MNMKTNLRFSILAPLVASTAVLAAGCASTVISDKTLIHKTAFGLGVNETDVTLIKRENDGFMTRYTVQTKAGKKYNCEVGGTIGTIGEPGCLEAGPSANTCNPLLKAAKKC